MEDNILLETKLYQYRYLLDEEKLELTRFKYGEIKRRCVIYNGLTHIENDIVYINVDEYLLFKNHPFKMEKC